MDDEFEVWAHNLSAGRTALHNLNVYVKRAAVAWDQVADQHAALWESWKSFCADSIDETAMSVATDQKVRHKIDVAVEGIERLDDITKNTTSDLVEKVSSQIAEARKDLATLGNMFKTHQQRHKEWDKAAKYAANGKGTKETEELARKRYEETSKTIQRIMPQFFDAFELFLQRLNAQILQRQSYLLRKWRNELRHVLKLHNSPAQPGRGGHARTASSGGHARTASSGSRGGLPSMRSPGSDVGDIGSPAAPTPQSIKSDWHQEFLQIMPAMEALSLIGPHGMPSHLSGVDYEHETPSEIKEDVEDREGGGPPEESTPSATDKLTAPSQWFGGLLSGEGRIEKFAFHRRHHDDGMFWVPPELATREQAVADYDFEGQDEGDLHFSKGDTITILDHGTLEDRNWWRGSINGREGIFPCNYVHPLSSKPESKSYNDDTDKPSFSEYVPRGDKAAVGVTGASAAAAATAATKEDLFVAPAGPPPGFKEDSPAPPKLPHRPPHEVSHDEKIVSPERDSSEDAPALPHRPHSPLKAPQLALSTDVPGDSPALQSPIHAGGLKAREDPHLTNDRGPVFQSNPPEEYPETPLPDKSPLADALAHESPKSPLAEVPSSHLKEAEPQSVPDHEPPLPPRSPGHIIEPEHTEPERTETDFDFNGDDNPPLSPRPHPEAAFGQTEKDPIEQALEKPASNAEPSDPKAVDEDEDDLT